MKVLSAVDSGSRKCLVEVGNGVGERQLLDLAESPDWSADGLAWLPIKIRNLARASSKISGHIV